MAEQEGAERLHEQVASATGPYLASFTWTGRKFQAVDKEIQRLLSFADECRTDIQRLQDQQRALQIMCSKIGVHERPVAPAPVPKASLMLRSRTRSRSPITRHRKRK